MGGIDIFGCLWLFFVYSFLGWIAETCFCILKYRKFMNRGMLNSPLCIVYGFAAVIVTVGFPELFDEIPLLFLGCTGVCTLLEWFTGKILEKLDRKKWWDYSAKKWNLDGYICLQYSILWGVLGVLSVKFITPVLIKLYDMIPSLMMHMILWAFLGVLFVDVIGSAYIIRGNAKRNETIQKLDEGLSTGKRRFGRWLEKHILMRVQKAYPTINKGDRIEKTKITVFAQGCSFYKLAVLFFVGAFAGDIIEMVFCRITMGYWMSRSSVVWGPFSIVWGFAIVVATSLLYNCRNRSSTFIFAMGTVLGGVYEYLCSVFTEIVFGKIFWDYSGFTFNLGGRINLLFCFFWGIAGVAWLKAAYPFLSRWIEKIPMLPGKLVTWCLIIFMIVNSLVSAAALIRQDQREKNIPADNIVQQWLDENYDDETLYNIYPKAKMPKKLDKSADITYSNTRNEKIASKRL